MEIIKLKKGECGGLPCSVVGGYDGWTWGYPVPEDGAVLKFDTLEKATGGVFVSDAQMREAGYALSQDQGQHRRANLLANTLGRDELVEFACRLNLKGSGTKQDLAARISTCL